MLQVRFYSAVPDEKLKFVVIAAQYEGNWIFCRHRSRDTWEIPGGHREPGENIETAARRELWEETGARQFSLRPVSAYAVKDGTEETFGMLYVAEIKLLDPLPDFEMAERTFSAAQPERLTYPEIQPLLINRAGQIFS